MKCPKCGLINPDSALKCDCGYNFTTGEINGACFSQGQEKRKISDDQQVKDTKSIARARATAWLIDVVIPALFLQLFIAVVQAVEQVDSQGNEPLSIIVGWLSIALIVYMLIKDGLFGGRSIGKLICKLAVVDKDSGKACTIRQSFKRNLPLLIPIIPLIVAVQLSSREKRIGENWANTKVISSTIR